MVAGSAFHAEINLNSRLAMTDGAAKQALKESDLLPKWVNIRNRVGRHSRRRNSLVHFDAAVHRDSYEWFLIPNYLDPRQDDTWLDQKIDVHRINTYRNGFFKLAQDMRGFAAPLPWQPAASQHKGQ